jgi:hypothetical protein
LTGLRIEKDRHRLYLNHTVVTFVTTPEVAKRSLL